jgi:hypothetical protein
MTPLSLPTARALKRGEPRSDKDSMRQREARKELERLGLMPHADRFIAAMRSNYHEEYTSKGVVHAKEMPWRDYVALSEIFDSLGYDCKLPHIDGTNLYLREKYAKLRKAGKKSSILQNELDEIINAVDWDAFAVDYALELTSEACARPQESQHLELDLCAAAKLEYVSCTCPEEYLGLDLCACPGEAWSL